MAAFRNLPYRRSKAASQGMRGHRHLHTILFALLSNLVVAIAKLVAGLLTGSSAMLSESGHSFADSINEILLGVSLSRSKKPADPFHPYGHGRERFLWAFVAAISSFVIGGCFSVGLAIRQFGSEWTANHQILPWIVLAVALVADGASWIQSVRQAAKAAKDRGRPVWQYLFGTTDPVLRAIVVDDSASLLGIAIAACGLFASRLTGSGKPDAIASLLIGLLLGVTALLLARPLADLLVGRSLPNDLLLDIQKIMLDSPAVEEVIGLQAPYIGPEEAVVIAKIRPVEGTVAELAADMDELDRRIREASPYVADVFIDITSARPTKAQERK